MSSTFSYGYVFIRQHKFVALTRFKVRLASVSQWGFLSKLELSWYVFVLRVFVTAVPVRHVSVLSLNF